MSRRAKMQGGINQNKISNGYSVTHESPAFDRAFITITNQFPDSK